MRILILNWRCPRNPQAGGAEFLTHEIAKRLVASGHEVEWFSSAFRGSETEEDLDGVHIVRGGRQWTVHLHAFRRYFRHLSRRFDVVIDEVNTVPFFTPLWADIPVFMLIYQLAREVWWYESAFPINALGYMAEPVYLRCYRKVPVFTISQSTEEDLLSLGFTGGITRLEIGIEHRTSPRPEKATVPTFLFVGRLAPSKRVEHVIRAFAAFKTQQGSGQLWLVGTGKPSYETTLKRMAEHLGVAKDVGFLGRLSNLDKERRMAQSHALLVTSVREGWGLVVTEANATGTPAIVYDAPGLRDSVRDGETGLVVRDTPTSLADGMLRLWRDKSVYEKMCREAERWSQTFSLDRTTQILRSGIGAKAKVF